jgi:dTDP-4-amino-4,6-dideoxygalactose transaminase
MEMTLPFENLTRQYQDIRVEIMDAIEQVMCEGKFTMGPFLARFEREFAAYCETNYCVGVSSGTSALHLALLACGVGPGDEVITVPNTYIATVFAISYTGARPIFVDIDPVTHNLDVSKLEEKITPRTRAILPVHLYGQCVDMDALMDVALKHNLFVIEDDAHAHGSLYKGRKAGSLGHVGCFSFYPTKVLGAYGDGGAVTTSDERLYEKIKMLRYMGQQKKYYHEVIGYQQRLCDLQAAVLSVKLRHLDNWIAARRKWAHLYTDLLKETPVRTPIESQNGTHVYYMYTILAPQRNALQSYLSERGIHSTPVYPLEVPFQPAYADLGYRPGDFPFSHKQVDEILCLPMFPELTEEEVRYTANAIHTFYQC